MPPKAANPARRKGPAFKPPRPVKTPAQSTSAPAKRPWGASTKRTVNTSKKSRPSFEPATTIISSSQEEDVDGLSNLDSEDDMEDDPVNNTPGNVPPTSGNPIPRGLFERLLHSGFEDKNTKIQKGAMALVDKYIETFIREAVARVSYEREQASKGGGISDEFLQIEDLEKAAPQLVLDF